VGRASDRGADCTSKTDSETLVLYDQCSRCVVDELVMTTSQMTSCQVVSVLLRRLKQDGFRVYLLDGKSPQRALQPLYAVYKRRQK